MRIVKKAFYWTLISFLLGAFEYCEAQANIIAPPQNTTVCKGSDVNISCGYMSASALSTTWIINGRAFTSENLQDSLMYQLINPFNFKTSSLMVLSINVTTTFQCVVSNPIKTSTVGTVIVIYKQVVITAVGGYQYVYVLWSLPDNVTNDACEIVSFEVTLSSMNTSMTVDNVTGRSHNFTRLPDNTTFNVTVTGFNMMLKRIGFNFTSVRTTPAVDNTDDNNDDNDGTDDNPDDSDSDNNENHDDDNDNDDNGDDNRNSDDNDSNDGNNDGDNGGNDGDNDGDGDGNNNNDVNNGGDDNNNDGSNGNNNEDSNDHDGNIDGIADNNDSGGSVGAIAGGVIGGIVIVIVIVIILIGMYFLCKKKKGSIYDDTMNLKSPTTTDSSHVSRGESITDTQYDNVVYATPAQTVAIPHQTSASGEQYAVSTKAASKTNEKQPANKQCDDVHGTKMDAQGITYADLQELPTDVSPTFKDAAVTYSQIT